MALIVAFATASLYAQFQVTDAYLGANPVKYEGPCPGVIKFEGKVAANGKGIVKYIFLRSDGATDTQVKTLTFDGPGSKPVSTTWTLGGPELPSYEGWEAIKILSPNEMESNKADFKLVCSSGPTVKAQLTATPSKYCGRCPTTVQFSGTITVDKAGRYQYKFIRSDNASAPVQTLTFAAPGSKPVSTTWMLGKSYDGWEAIQIISPVNVQSNKAEFRLVCIPDEKILAGSPNMLQNPDFSTVGPSGTSTTFTGNEFAGNSAAANWTLYNNGPATITTELVSGTRRGGSSKMIHVTTTGSYSGLVQVFLPLNTGPEHVISSAWVFVKSGRVGIGTGNGGNGGIDDTNSAIGRWELIRGCNGISPANEVVIYSVSDGADFYVDFARTTKVE